MSLKMHCSIKMFATYLVVQYSKIHCIDPDIISNLEDFMKKGHTEEILKSIDLLFKYYKVNIEEIYTTENFEKYVEHILLSKTEYMKTLLSRCLKLSEDPTFFEFLLVCVYICKTAECLAAKYSCFKVLKLAADCLEATYCRKYHEYFNENGSFQGLDDFCKSLNNCSPSMKYEYDVCLTLFGVLEPERNEKVKIFKYLNDIDGKQISLNPFEEKLLVDKPYFVVEHNFCRSNDFLIDCEAKNEILGSEQKECELVSKEVYKVLCIYCKTNCFQYLNDFSNLPEIIIGTSPCDN